MRDHNHTGTKNVKAIYALAVVALLSLSAVNLLTENGPSSSLRRRMTPIALEVETRSRISSDSGGDNSNAQQTAQDDITICGRNSDIIGTSQDLILKDIYHAAATNREYMPSSSCPKFDKSKPMLLLEGANAWGRTGNHMREFIRAMQYTRDSNLQLGMTMNSWAMNLISSMFMVRGDDWVSQMEEAFCIKVLQTSEDFEGIKKVKIRSDTPGSQTHKLFEYKSPKPWEEIISREVNTMKTFFQHYNDGEGILADGNRTKDMCSGVNSIFGEDDRKSAIFTAIHHRFMEGTDGLTRQSEHTGCDPHAAADITPEYIKSILQPLDMLKHPIVVMTDGQNEAGIQRLRDDPEIGLVLRLVPEDACWIGGDITLGVVANVFIGNPASTFSGFMARVRASLGYGNSYLYRAKDENGEWSTTCRDECSFELRLSEDKSGYTYLWSS